MSAAASATLKFMTNKLSGSRPRLQDVATLAGVSLSAASRILRGDEDDFGTDTCRRVLAAAEKIGWRRNLLVSGMQTGRTRTVGVVIPPYDSFWVGVLAGIHGALGDDDYLPITVWLGDLDHIPHFEADEDQGVALMNRLLDRRVDGLILWPPFGLAYYERARELRDRTVPVVMIDYHGDKPICDTVTTNELQAAKDVAKHLVALGHRRIAYIGGRKTASQAWAEERCQSLEAALAGHAEVEFASWRLNRDGSDAPEVCRRLLTSRFRPTAVVAASDHEAKHVYRVAADLGLAIPDDISVVGFADLDFARSMAPPLTTVRQRSSQIGRRAAALLLGRLAGKAMGDFLDDRIDADFVHRHSTGPAVRR
jgi:LacI family transcriptional regulator